MSEAHDARQYSKATERGWVPRRPPLLSRLREAVSCALLCTALALLLALAFAPSGAHAAEPTNAGANLRDGWYPEQGTLTPNPAPAPSATPPPPTPSSG